jgi:aromatic ring-opening dioxygenase catalytic subunit (LigB family)
MEPSLPTYFISHGGGPWPWMKNEMGGAFDQLEQSILDVRRELDERPRAVLMVTGHWEEHDFAISSADHPGMLYDYGGFPEYTYRIHYRAPGSPALAARVQELLSGGGIDARLDPDRGFDHGTFSVMKPLYPEENIPLVQLSIQRSYDPELHLEVGRLLAPLRREGVLIIGSGLSYHNLRMRDPRAVIPSREFDAWLQDSLVAASPEKRTDRLLQWQSAPYARTAHPREDHLIPLMVAVGAAENEPGACIYHQDDLLGYWMASSFRFGVVPQPAEPEPRSQVTA